MSKGEKPKYIFDDPEKRTLERYELGDTDQSLWQTGSDGTPLNPWCRFGQIDLIRVEDGARLVFEATAPSAVQELEDLVSRFVWLARDKGPNAKPIIVIGTRQVRNARKNQNFWIPTFTIVRWSDDPAPRPEPPDTTNGSVPLAPPPERQPRDVFQANGPTGRDRAQQLQDRQRLIKCPGEPMLSLKDELDDAIRF